MERYLCIHGHFYQPPRENPWLETVEVQDSAYPYHDWNERITAECYRPNAAARLMNKAGKIAGIFNNYAHMSFNFGPTLLSWMEENEPGTYELIIAADKLSRERFSGHGSALAQIYNHVIMPLAAPRDKRTQVVWGVEDFRKRFGRDPEGMWLPECAADSETLDILAEHGIAFTILAPWQGTHIRRIGGAAEWQEVEWGAIDTTIPYRCTLPSGRSITLFFYEGSTAYAIAGAGLLKRSDAGDAFVERLTGIFKPGSAPVQLAHIANDGESYGHHHKFGDMALAYCLHTIESKGLAKLTNYAEFLEKHPPTHEVRLRENSSWSCVHGVERWRSDCGCNSGQFPRWHQKWRRPLRDALDELRDELIPAYEHDMRDYVRDPWAMRDAYIGCILDRSRENVDRFISRHALWALSAEETTRVLKLLELQRHAMAMYTSCGWFYDEVSGLETVQVMKYAARAMQRAAELFGYSLEPNFITDLEKAPSNYDAHAAESYERLVVPSKVDLSRVTAHYAIASLFKEAPEHMKIYNFTLESAPYRRMKSGKFTLATGIVHTAADFTRERATKCFAVLHFGDHSFKTGIRDFSAGDGFAAISGSIIAAFERGAATEVMRIIEKHFGATNYSLAHLFRDEQRKIIDHILESTHTGIEAEFREIYERSSPVMNFLSALEIALPPVMRVAAEHIINVDMKRGLSAEAVDTERLDRLIKESRRWGIPLDTEALSYLVPRWLHAAMERIVRDCGRNGDGREGAILENASAVAGLVAPLDLAMNLWLPQNSYFLLRETFYPGIRKKAAEGDPAARRSAEAFGRLGSYLNIDVS
ncbi:MAG: DUF3536 domain-containing protein [Nitrospirota bacterium]